MTRWHYIFICTSILINSSACMAQTLFNNCAKPTIGTRNQSFFVDPVNGSMDNDGSAKRPWRTLAEVVELQNKLVKTKAYSNKYRSGDHTLHHINPNGVIKPGDTIYLMSGDHGAPLIQGYINSQFITVMAANGQTPVVKSMMINGSSHWIFKGIKFQGRNTSTWAVNALIDVGRSDWLGPTDNIIFISNSISTQDNISEWVDTDWVSIPFYYGLYTMGSCVEISNNHFFNLRNALAISGDGTLVQDNTIDNFGNDGIDITASDLIIRRNIIKNGRHTAAEELHADGIQGWNLKEKINKNVIIDSNFIIKTQTANTKSDYMQGIGIFDGKWDGLTVTNNVVVTNTWHAIALYGIQNALVANNTIVSSDPVNHPAWIMIHDGKDKAPSKNVVIRNNITTSLIYAGDNVVADHNIASKSITTVVEGKSKDFTSGSIKFQNFIDPRIYNTFFKVDNKNGVYDLRLKSDSPAIKAGNADKAPTNDIIGKKRAQPIDIGAYAR